MWRCSRATRGCGLNHLNELVADTKAENLALRRSVPRRTMSWVRKRELDMLPPKTSQ